MKAILILISLGFLGAVQLQERLVAERPTKLVYNIQRQPIEKQILAPQMFLTQRQPFKQVVQPSLQTMYNLGQKEDHVQVKVMDRSSVLLKAKLEGLVSCLNNVCSKWDAVQYEEGKLADPKFRAAVKYFAPEKKELDKAINAVNGAIYIVGMNMATRGSSGDPWLVSEMDPTSSRLLKTKLEEALIHLNNVCDKWNFVQYEDGKLADLKFRTAVKYFAPERKELDEAIEGLKGAINILGKNISEGEGVTITNTKGVDKKNIGFSEYIMQ